MNIEKNKTIKISWARVLIAVVFFTIGYLSFGYIDSLKKRSLGEENLDLFWSVWELMDTKYVSEQPNNEQKIYGAISGLVASYGDIYSRFLSPVETEYFEQTITGEFGGIGAEIGIRNGFLTVITPLKDSPSERLGVRSLDIITHIEGISVVDYSLDQAISKIRGPIGTNVRISIARSGEEEIFDIIIPRESVTIPILETDMIDEVFVIHLYNFNDDSETKFKQALEEFKQSGSKKLLLDVRNNPGGYLGAIVDMASYFIPQGLPIVREEFGSTKEREIIYRSKGYGLLTYHDFEVAFLVNEGSASASEIFAGALRDHLNATIFGMTTYGKGSVQELITLPQKTALKVTVARWLTPKGQYISEKGIEPDIVIEYQSLSEQDIQLEEAIKQFSSE